MRLRQVSLVVKGSLLAISMSAATARAQDEPPPDAPAPENAPPPDAPAPAAAPVRPAPAPEAPAVAPAPPAQDSSASRGALMTRRYGSYDKYENSLDVKLTSLYDHEASNVASPTVMLTAQWNYMFQTETYVGLTLSGVPQSQAVKVDGGKRAYTTYYGGLNLAQSLWSDEEYRITLSVSGGQGYLYVRDMPTGAEKKLHGARYMFVEPSVWVTFFRYSGLDIGVVVSQRLAKLEEKSAYAENKDLSALSYGVTFRTQGQ